MPRVKIAPPRRPQRRRPQTGLLTWPPTAQTVRLAATAASAVFVLASSLYVWRAGIPDFVVDAYDGTRARMLALSGGAGLKVQEIFIEGRGETCVRCGKPFRRGTGNKGELCRDCAREGVAYEDGLR